MFDLNLVGSGESLRVNEQWNDGVKAVLCKNQSNCAVEDWWEWREIRKERTTQWPTHLIRARIKVVIVQTEEMGWVPGTLGIRIKRM